MFAAAKQGECLLMLSQKTPLQQCRLRAQFEGNQCWQDSVVCSQFRRARDALAAPIGPNAPATATKSALDGRACFEPPRQL